ncbi:hypothetical protein CHLRE_15g640251v5 [Chlamydomonas reinhardtii]|uniref:Uncharacterized protein n=1 Tax=Chlamydomonas reinhardtii TaxID=3055 RepID=A0A2K3CWM4_CHLRE|nr:uncharacterized protein CHLRE_15g640251v5 [Chlamydomonas reinhardtii]PNW72684.1 hypothetical protein CHLRE_15g640251v5 [Chlamydomonas reinhardtii]
MPGLLLIGRRSIFVDDWLDWRTGEKWRRTLMMLFLMPPQRALHNRRHTLPHNGGLFQVAW